jgi:hypothetical protein
MKLLYEELTKTDKDDVKKMVKSEIKDLLNKDLEKEVLTILKKEIKGNKELESRMEEVSTKVLVSLYKTLWMKRNFWTTRLGK